MEKKYDFKRTNGTGKNFTTKEDVYKGMPLALEGEDKSKPVFASARDVGNMGAGMVAGFDGMGWSVFRIFADGLQATKGNEKTESSSTQYAQKLGHRIGHQAFLKYIRSRRPGEGQLRSTNISKAIIKKDKDLYKIN